MTSKLLPKQLKIELVHTLATRFEAHRIRHTTVNWIDIHSVITENYDLLLSICQMEQTGGEPDVFEFNNELYFVDSAIESPSGRRSLCYDADALEERKENKPAGSALGMAMSMGIDLLNEEQYKLLQSYRPVDTKTSSWLLTPPAIRKHGGAIFGDRRYDHAFVYHNGAQSYYASRGFRGIIPIK